MSKNDFVAPQNSLSDFFHNVDPFTYSTQSCPTELKVDSSGDGSPFVKDVSSSSVLRTEVGDGNINNQAPKTGVVIANNLQNRLYNRPCDADVLRLANNQLIPRPPGKETSSRNRKARGAFKTTIFRSDKKPIKPIGINSNPSN
jgi:hypothetical protein